MLVSSPPERDLRGTLARIVRCGDCGSFLDAPRPHPATGEQARKCAVCLTWEPVEPEPAVAVR